MKSSVDVRWLAERLGLEVGRDGMMRCLWHPDSGRPNARVYADGIYCFRCGKQASALELVQAAEGLQVREGLLMLRAVAGEAVTFSAPKPEDRAEARALYGYLCELAHEAVQKGYGRAWFTGRGIRPETVEQYRLGAVTPEVYPDVAAALGGCASAELLREAGLVNDRDNLRYYNRAIFPFLHRGHVLYLQGRAMDDGHPKYLGPRGRNAPLYNPDVLASAEPGSAVWLCEGPIDTLHVLQSGRQAIGIPGVNAWREDQLHGFDGLHTVLCLDADRAGREAARKLGLALLPVVGTARLWVAVLPEGTDAAQWDWTMGRPPVVAWQRWYK